MSFIKYDPTNHQLICQGKWQLSTIQQIKNEFAMISWPSSGTLIINGKSIEHLDSAGAWLLHEFANKLNQRKFQVEFKNFSKQQQELLELVQKQAASLKEIPEPFTLNAIQKLGRYTLQQMDELKCYFAFVGELSFESLRVMMNPARWRWRPIVSSINKTGAEALPIIALLSFMIGIVISYQMGNQLRKYGANIFIVDLLGLSVLREFGPLLSAIMVAGRTGSAFTAQLGIMKINQEIDALDTIGVTPPDILLIPRIIALVIVLPLLTIWSDIFGIIGGMVMANSMLGVTWHEFLLRFNQEIPLRALLIGLGKAPVFALLIASIGCFQGMQVKGSAESVGTRTTRSVVLSIFFIIIVDGIFSILFSKFNL